VQPPVFESRLRHGLVRLDIDLELDSREQGAMAAKAQELQDWGQAQSYGAYSHHL
jgi:hypothetical protein